ncbi:hypothetical protein, partial [Paractinoplanes durhamensis]|uniref:hypothetical protein n=1 Tax=Paractinoplanes durhamensis TaxID=113563 RepID=UPI0031D1BD30
LGWAGSGFATRTPAPAPPLPHLSWVLGWAGSGFATRTAPHRTAPPPPTHPPRRWRLAFFVGYEDSYAGQALD